MNINIEIRKATQNVVMLRRLLNREKSNLKQLRFNRKMRDRRRK